jgi:MFS family permease
LTSALSEAERRAYEANVWKFWLFRYLLEAQLWLPIWVIYLQEERGLSLTTVTLMDVPFWLLMVVAEVPTGAVADRWGRKFSISLGTLIYTAAVFTFGVGETVPILLAAYLIWGLAWTLWSGADAAFLYDSLRVLGRQDEYQKAYGKSWAAAFAGSITGLLVGAPLADATTLWFPVVLSAAMAFGAWLVTLRFKEPPRLEEHEAQAGYIEGLRRAARIVFGQRQIRWTILLWSALTAISLSVTILMQPFLADHDVDVSLYGWLAAPGIAVAMAGSLMAGRLSSALGQVRLICLLPILPLFAMVVIGAFDTVYAYAAFPLLSLTRGLAQPTFSDFVNRRVGSAQRATILSIQALLFSLMLAPLEPGLGRIADTVSIPRAFSVAALLLVVIGGVLLLLWVNSLRHEDEVEIEDLKPAPAP